MDTAGSVTIIVRGIRAGDEAKVTPLWGLYFERLTHHAAKYLGTRAPENEDAALSAINDFCNGLAKGRFDYVDKRDKLWGALATITERKALRHLKAGRFRKEVMFTDLQPRAPFGGEQSARAAIVEPVEAYEDIVRMELEELIETLPNPLWRQAVRMVMEGYSAPEIAARLERTRECVYIWFRTIRAIWEEKLGRENLLD